MKWFKHFSAAKYDPRIMRLIKKFGLRGYGLYFAIVEYISNQLETTKPLPDLEENSQDIASFFNEDTVLIEEMLLFCVNQGLFEQDENTGRIVCLKLLCHLDNTMANNPEIKKIIDSFNSMDKSNIIKLEETSRNFKQLEEPKSRLDKIRLDKNRKEKDKSDSFSAQRFEVISFLNYCLEKKKGFDPNSKDIKKHMDARFKEGATVEEMKEVIIVKCSHWICNPDMKMYLRPTTLFSPKYHTYKLEDRKILKDFTTKETMDIETFLNLEGYNGPDCQTVD